MARILVAEDDAETRHLVTQLLIDDGHEVAAVTEAALLLDNLQINPPDLLIIDVTMPGVDGYAVLEKLHESGHDSSVRVMVLSAGGAEQDFERSYALGACQHITMPFDPYELVASVAQLLTLTRVEMRELRELERERAHLLSQLETIFSED